MKNISVHIRYAVLIIFGISLIFLASNIANSEEFPTWTEVLKTFGWTSFYCIPFYAANAFIYSVIHKKFSFNNWKNFLKRLILGIIVSGLISVLLGGVLFVLEGIISGDGFAETVNWVFSVESLDEIQRLIWISSTVAIVMYVFIFIRKYQEEKLKIQKQKTVRISTEHESLKSQIGPHFLFNSLNVLNGLIDENPHKAQEFVSELSSVYRYVLEQKDKSLVSLREEIDFSKTYMNLIQKRFEDGLAFEIQENIPEDFQIVPLSLQILLENCIKHNRISANEPLKVKVYIENDKLIIHNNLQIKNQMNQSTGKGLQNIINRYKTFTEQKVEIIKTEREFIVKIPLLTEKIITMEIEKNYTKEEYKTAKKRVEEIQGFYWNLASYVIVNSFFLFLDLRDNGELDWAFWPLAGWGIGVVFHAIETFGFFNSQSWKDRMVQKELERRQREREEFNSKFNN
jgi:hypothetical protein